jgi:branched-chain amino acid transport system permease protein
MSENYRIEQSTPASRVGTAVGLGLVVALFAAPWWAGRADLRLFGEIYIYIALASLWNLLAGYTGLVSVGQQLYVGLGGYVLFALALFLGVSPLVAIPAAGVAGILIALPVS